MNGLIPGLGFGAPLILWALLLLPLIWWLLRFTPPKPFSTFFPPIRLLLKLRNREETPSHSPWWLTLLRISLAGLVILALSEPVFRPDTSQSRLSAPLVILVDNGWAAAANWNSRQQIAREEIMRARDSGFPVALVPTVPGATNSIVFETPDDALDRLQSLSPKPYAPARQILLEHLAPALAEQDTLNFLWLSDGLGYERDVDFAAKLIELADQFSLTVFVPEPGANPVFLGIPEQTNTGLDISVNRIIATNARLGRVEARALNGRLLSEQEFFLGEGVMTTRVEFVMPLELRNQVTRIEISGEHSAGAVRLLDDRWRKHRVGLISGENLDAAQPLLSPLFYIEKALAPFAEIHTGIEPTIPENIERMISEQVDVIVMADVGNLAPETSEALASWVNQGGMLIRFAGPRLASGSFDLLPVRLRNGSRTLGGTLSWSDPQPLAEFSQTSPFSDLEVPSDVTVSRQILAEPDIGLPERIWARLQDGTPLVTGTRHGTGWLVLFHVTASPDWSNLPLSGTFVDMLGKLLERSGFSQISASDSGEEDTSATTSISLPPVSILDAAGVAGPPPANAIPISANDFARHVAGPDTPPGFYGHDEALLALNTIAADTKFSLLPAPPADARQLTYARLAPTPIKRWLLLAAFGLLLLDGLAVIFLSGGLRRLITKAGPISPVVFAFALTILATGNLAIAQTTQTSAGQLSAAEEFALRAANETRLAYVVTGNPEIDETARAGLTGLSRILQQRTAMEPGAPIGVNISQDELAFFPLIYWPLTADARPLDTNTAARIDAYMRHGGTILFDTREQTITLDPNDGGPGMAALRRVLASLDIPPIEPVPASHVLTKAFYLLQDFPGRYEGGRLWTESAHNGTANGARNADGVSTILITSNDLAAAWAIDDSGRPVFPVAPGGNRQREIAYRVGVNIVMYTLTGNYKADQVHIPALLERLGQ